MKRRLLRRLAKPRPSGFTLVEVTVYLALSSILACLAFSLFNQTSLSIARRSAAHQDLVRTTIFVDLLKRDLASASMQSADWVAKRATFKQEFIDPRGNLESQWVSWSVSKDGLMRSYGLYEPAKKQWARKQTDFFGCGVTEVRLEPVINRDTNCVEAVAVTYEQQSKIYQATVPLQNRIIV
ncbi:prepilin-type N-terminal cleavage/methylation domain-containing protein [Candidatus Babeliales bacterium]|nr:prepilin-type N-terminal cleavage/methylation domain-containing protein [Candidatus Babeliales bacterium]